MMDSAAARRETKRGNMLSHHGTSSPYAAISRAIRKPSIQSRDHQHLYLKTRSPRGSSACRLVWLVVVLLVASLFTTSEAAHGDLRDRRRRPPFPAIPVITDNVVPAPKSHSLLLIDTRPPPYVPPLMPPTNDGNFNHIRSAPSTKRADDGFQVPRPFDSSLSNNFTDNCDNFFQRMLSSETITQCHPFSMLLQTSNGLFEASKSFVRITQTLEATCAANMPQCLVGMNALARELTTNSACGVDYNNNNAQAVQAYNALIAYEPLYRASCLRDDDGNFCYANAVTNTTSQGSDANPYYMPLGMKLVSGRPTCNSCLQKTMAIFSTFAGNTSQPIHQTYPAGAQQITVYCGQNFVNVTAAPLKGAASTTATAFTPTLTLLVMFLLYIFQ